MIIALMQRSYKEPFRRYADVQISQGEGHNTEDLGFIRRHGSHREADKPGPKEKITSRHTSAPFTSSIWRSAAGTQSSFDMSRSKNSSSLDAITIPCHHIRIGDLLILQGRPCQVIRISTSEATGQHRYLGVDLFTKQLHEESSFASNPAPSVLVQNMTGPVFKQYRLLDLGEDGSVVAMTDSGDIKQSLAVLDQSGLLGRLAAAFDRGRGSVRVLVIGDGGRELAVDYKLVHGTSL